MTPPWQPLASSLERDHWLAQRKRGIGASEIASVLHLSPWRPAIELWAIKTGKVPDPDLADNEAVFWGLALEEAIIRGFGRRTGRPVVPFGVLLQSQAHPWLLGTPDALTTDDPVAAARADDLRNALQALIGAITGGPSPDLEEIATRVHAAAMGWWPLQVKNANDRQGDAWADGPPEYYSVQGCQEAIVFGGVPRATICALIGGNQLAWSDVDVTEYTHRRIVNLGRKFWEDHVLVGMPPSPDGTEACRKLLAKLWPEEDPDQTIALPQVLQVNCQLAARLRCSDDDRETMPTDSEPELGMTIEELDGIWLRARDEKRQAESRQKLAESILRLAIGDAVTGVLPDGSRYNLKTVRQPEKVIPACSYRNLTRQQPPKPRKGRP